MITYTTKFPVNDSLTKEEFIKNRNQMESREPT